MDFVALGKRIRQQRKMLKLTQAELAEKIGVSTSYIGHIERGLKHCSLESIVALSNVLHITPDILLQDSLNDNVAENCMDMPIKARSIINDLVNVLREYDVIKD